MGFILTALTNTQISYNNVRNNGKSGILTEHDAKTLTIKENNISDNYYGIRLNSVNNSGIQIKTNYIKRNEERINFTANYKDYEKETSL